MIMPDSRIPFSPDQVAELKSVYFIHFTITALTITELMEEY